MSDHTKGRFVIEGTWSGYVSAQQRVVHRTVHPASFKRLRAWAESVHGIRYTDGTMLYLTVRNTTPRERVKQIHGYDSLINDCQFYDVNSVAGLAQAQERFRAEAAAKRTEQVTT